MALRRVLNSSVSILLMSCLISCGNPAVFDTTTAIPNNLWESDSAVSFTFEIRDTLSKNNVFLTLRNTNEYAFSNLFLITHLNFPNGKEIVDTLEYEMADPSGRFLGKGMSSIKENVLFYKEQKVFPVSGIYSLSVEHAMRKNGQIEGMQQLEGISSVGIRIEKAH